MNCYRIYQKSLNVIYPFTFYKQKCKLASLLLGHPVYDVTLKVSCMRCKILFNNTVLNIIYIYHQSELVGDVAVPVSVCQAVLF